MMGPRRENAVWMGESWPPGHDVEKEKGRDEVGQPCRYCIVLLQVQQLVSLSACLACLACVRRLVQAPSRRGNKSTLSAGRWDGN